jgi:hypothetical protein
MSKKRTATAPLVDPTLPTFPVEIDGKTYTLCLDFSTLAQAERELQRQGHDICILRHMPSLSFELVKAFFVCGVHRFHPDLAFEDAEKLVRLDTVWLIAKCIDIAYAMAMPPKEDTPGEVQPGE